jgi:hypothetical protein
MNPRETQAGGSARDHLSAIEAHIKGRPLDPAFPELFGLCRSAYVSERPRPNGHGNMVSPSQAKLCPTPGSEPMVTD